MDNNVAIMERKTGMEKFTSSDVSVNIALQD